MKPLLPALLVLFFCSIFSCTKTNNVKTTVYDTTTVVVRDTVYQTSARNPIVGLWIGTFKVDGDATDSFYYSFNIDANGQMISLDADAAGNSASGAGPWQLNGTAFTASLNALDAPGNVQGIAASYDSVGGTLSGQNNYTQGSGLNTTFLLFRVSQ